MSGKHKVIIIGGGLAGISAAIELAEKGLNPLVLEAAPIIGGKVKGWVSPNGHSLEHGLHGWWNDYVNFKELLSRIKVVNQLTPPIDSLNIYQKNGTIDKIKTINLPAPFHLLIFFKTLKSLNIREKFSCLIAGMLILTSNTKRVFSKYDRIDMYSWLKSKNVSEHAIQTVFEPVLRSNLFLPLSDISAASGIYALKIGLKTKNSWKFSWLKGNTRDYLWEPLVSYLLEKGGEIKLQTRVESIQTKDGCVNEIQCSNSNGESEIYRAEQFVLAVDIEAAKSLVNSSNLKPYPFFRNFLNLKSTDVLVCRIWYDGTFPWIENHGLLKDPEIADVFINVGEFQKDLLPNTYTVIETQSYLARDVIEASNDIIESLVLDDLERANPELKGHLPISFHIIRHPAMFFAFGIDSHQYMPKVESPLKNLFLAGDWVKTGQPAAFMEGAVLSGKMAANNICILNNLKTSKIEKYPTADWPVRIFTVLLQIFISLASIIKFIFRYKTLTSQK